MNLVLFQALPSIHHWFYTENSTVCPRSLAITVDIEIVKTCRTPILMIGILPHDLDWSLNCIYFRKPSVQEVLHIFQRQLAILKWSRLLGQQVLMIEIPPPSTILIWFLSASRSDHWVSKNSCPFYIPSRYIKWYKKGQNILEKRSLMMLKSSLPIF